ncbi:hypothetical protein GGQ68_004339 [Sagittula marina]|uniref:Uncharacterized protein n=1 Tax=Sagittula marina TaxID=943940 RepID=A0A7W6DRP0_9RHOB|nr:hypothetical protein [Sagittula marina]MBB3987985.1 hypothetical protein [Sagittula marina]
MTDQVPQRNRSFDSFNARFLTSEEVAATFIPPKQYNELLSVGHSVLFGPRGSGKTTLLKMLQLRSLASWRHQSATSVRRSLGFHSIFLGTDVLWGSQLEAICNRITDVHRSDQIRRTSFRIHLSLAVLKALEEASDDIVLQCPDLQHLAIQPTQQSQRSLANALASIWNIDGGATSILGLRHSLRRQLTQLQISIDKIIEDPSSDIPDFARLHPMQPVLLGIETINEALNLGSRKWAILCDELEIAPDLIRNDLFSLLRSTSHDVLFKFSLFPYTSDLEEVIKGDAPGSNNDFQPLNLSYPHKEAAYPFCEELFRGMVERVLPEHEGDPVSLLGEGWFDGGRSSRQSSLNAYSVPHGKNFLKAQSLARKDQSFTRWLKRKKIVLRQLDGAPEDSQAQFRKGMPFILTREEFLADDGSFRSRKASTLYTGAYSLFSFTEGNPRIFINLMKPLLEQIASNGGTVGATSQARSLDATMHRYKASLSAIPTTGYKDIQSIMQLVDVVGTYLQREQLVSDFSPEPPTTVIVDNVDGALINLVGRAVNSGVFILMPPERGADPKLISEKNALNGARLRLSYTLAPSYKLPLISGRTVPLSKIIHTRNAAKRRRPEMVGQFTLPFEVDE